MYGLICEPVTMVDCVRCSYKFRRICCLYAVFVLSCPPTCHTVHFVTAALCTLHIIFLATSTFTFVMYINLFSHGVHWSLMNCLYWIYCLTLFYLKSRVTIKIVEFSIKEGGGAIRPDFPLRKQKLRDVQQRAKGNKFLQVKASFRQKVSKSSPHLI